jgi:hypothetical protein
MNENWSDTVTAPAKHAALAAEPVPLGMAAHLAANRHMDTRLGTQLFSTVQDSMSPQHPQPQTGFFVHPPTWSAARRAFLARHGLGATLPGRVRLSKQARREKARLEMERWVDE